MRYNARCTWQLIITVVQANGYGKTVRYQQIVTNASNSVSSKNASNSKELIFGEEHSKQLKQRQRAKHKEKTIFGEELRPI
jgi:hypothetical protein